MIVSSDSRRAADSPPELEGSAGVSDPLIAQALGARLDRLPSSWVLWRLVVLISLGGFFEAYELFSTSFVVPGIVRSGILTTSTAQFFGEAGVASYIAASFVGLFIGSFVFGFVADRVGRRAAFTYSLLWYSFAAFATALQHSAGGLNFWRLMTGIGLGVELVTIDAYLGELMPAHMRGRGFALSQAIIYVSFPTVAFISWRLVPFSPFGYEGWRWVIALGAIGSLFVWFLRRGLPESPRWLADRNLTGRAEIIIADIEKRIETKTGHRLDLPAVSPERATLGKRETGTFRELWGADYGRRTVMLLLFNIAQAIGLYGFQNWAPTFLTSQGVTITHSLGYTFGIACAAPFGPLISISFADRVERKWQIVVSALCVAIAGMMFSQVRLPAFIVLFGCVVTIGTTIISVNFHAYQAELYPTRIRALAVGFVYSASRLAGMFSGFLIAFALGHFGVTAALIVIALNMVVAALSVGIMGPRTCGLPLESISR
jgi:putative MFS transporter